MIGIPQDVRDLALDRLAVEIGEVHAFGRQHGHIAIGQEKHVACVAEDRRHIGRHEILAVAQPDHRRRTGARRHDLVRIAIARQSPSAKHAREFLHSGPHSFFQIPLVSTSPPGAR